MVLSIISILLVIAGVVMWFILPELLIGYGIGIALGITLTLSTVRRLGRKSKHSIFLSMLFYKLTRYRASIYNISRRPYNISLTVHDNGDNDDYANLMDVLQRQMKFTAPIAKEATNYALDTAKDKPLQDKITIALQYLDEQNNLVNATQ